MPPQTAVPSTREELVRLYQTEGHPIAYAAPSKIYAYFRGKLKLNFIRRALEHVDAHTLHREYKRPRVFNPFYAYVRRQRFQADLITVQSLKGANDGVAYLNLIIDTFSRKIWVIPQRDKSGAATAAGLEAWLRLIADDSHPGKQLLTDAGREYCNAAARRVFRAHGVKHETTTNIVKSALAERANKSLQVLIYKYLTDRGEDRYLDALPGLVRSYNDRPHRSLDNRSPNFADKKGNELFIRGLQAGRFAERHKRGGRTPKLAPGDRVRIKTYGTGINTARRAYLQQFKGELFTVRSANSTLPVPLYNIRSMDTEEDISGGFYANELQRVRGDSFKVEAVLRRRGTGEDEEFLVKWKDFGPRWNSWVKRSDFE